MRNRIRASKATLPLALLLASPAAAAPDLYLGADLSFVNEVEDCGGVYRKDGKPVDPFELMKAEGGNIVRVRLWNEPPGNYSTLADVEKTIRRARAAGHEILLNFHYSDSWADGDKQPIPKAWKGLDTDAQAKALYDYTRDVLARLAAAGLMPEMVQVGNETNPEMLGGTSKVPINWVRNARILNAGIKAVRDAGEASGTKPRIMLHIAQPENVLPWFDAATAHHVTGYDLIGVSYYRKWSKRTMAELGETIAEAKRRYGTDVILVETAYPFTTEDADKLNNILGPDTLIGAYPATPEGQLKYLTDITQIVVDNGGIGVVWWEPAWLSTGCKTPDGYGPGSPWDNANWFDFRNGNEALPALRFFRHDYHKKPRPQPGRLSPDGGSANEAESF
jgi:arabinogalactan endo-1,4-beta-galactosidase